MCPKIFQIQHTCLFGTGWVGLRFQLDDSKCNFPPDDDSGMDELMNTYYSIYFGDEDPEHPRNLNTTNCSFFFLTFL